jgi:hypothetical protein
MFLYFLKLDMLVADGFVSDSLWRAFFWERETKRPLVICVLIGWIFLLTRTVFLGKLSS